MIIEKSDVDVPVQRHIDLHRTKIGEIVVLFRGSVSLSDQKQENGVIGT